MKKMVSYVYFPCLVFEILLTLGPKRAKKGQKCADVSIYELVFIKNGFFHYIELSILFSKMVWFVKF